MCSFVMTSRMPVQVMNTWPVLHAFDMGSTSNPSMNASSALTGSTSVTTTREPMPRHLAATPLPTQPYPATTTRLEAISRFMARR